MVFALMEQRCQKINMHCFFSCQVCFLYNKPTSRLETVLFNRKFGDMCKETPPPLGIACENNTLCHS